jgi:hypothetical protein
LVEHEWCAEYLEREERRQTEREQELENHDWANRDREYIVSQARAVASIWYRAHKLLKENRDDPEAFALIARALQKSPPIPSRACATSTVSTKARTRCGASSRSTAKTAE